MQRDVGDQSEPGVGGASGGLQNGRARTHRRPPVPAAPVRLPDLMWPSRTSCFCVDVTQCHPRMLLATSRPAVTPAPNFPGPTLVIGSYR